MFLFLKDGRLKMIQGTAQMNFIAHTRDISPVRALQVEQDVLQQESLKVKDKSTFKKFLCGKTILFARIVSKQT